MKQIIILILCITPQLMAASTSWETFRGGAPLEQKSFNVDYYTGTSMMLGYGYDSFKDDSSGKCAKVPASQYDRERTPDTVQESVFKLELVESKYDLAKKLGVTAAASLKSGFSKASATVNYLNEQSLNQYSIYILVSAEILTPLERAKDEDIDPDYINYARSNPKEFRNKCGNEYVAAIQRGGVYYGLLKLDTENSSSYTQIKIALRGRVGTFKAAADLERSISEVIFHKSLQIFTYQIGGENKPHPTNVPELIDRVKNFPAEVTKNPVPLRAITAPYMQLKNFPIESTAFDTSVQEGVIDYLSQLRFKIIDHRNDLIYILNNKSQFQVFSAEDLNNRVDYINTKLNEINLMSKKCLLNFDNCQYPTEFNYKDFNLPERLNQAIADNQCKERVHLECGYIYKLGKNAACGVKTYNLGKAKVCGVKRYVTKRSDACEAENYKQSSGPECGVQAYNQKTDGSVCGYTQSGSGCHFVPVQTKAYEFKTNDPFKGSSCDYRPKSCRHPNFGPESYNSCRHPNFGVESFKECADASHGVEEYNECRNPQFGIEEYETCAHVANGVEGIRQCKLLETLDSETGNLKYSRCE